MYSVQFLNVQCVVEMYMYSRKCIVYSRECVVCSWKCIVRVENVQCVVQNVQCVGTYEQCVVAICVLFWNYTFTIQLLNMYTNYTIPCLLMMPKTVPKQLWENTHTAFFELEIDQNDAL